MYQIMYTCLYLGVYIFFHKNEVCIWFVLHSQRCFKFINKYTLRLSNFLNVDCVISIEAALVVLLLWNESGHKVLWNHEITDKD